MTIPATRRLAIVAAANRTGCEPGSDVWDTNAYAAMSVAERIEIDNAWYALPMPRPRFSDVLRRELLGTGETETKG